MKSALLQITARAKQLRKKNKNLQWKDAIKKASAEYNRKGSVKKPVAKKRSKVQKLKVFKAKRAAAVKKDPGHRTGTAERNRIESEIRKEIAIIKALKSAGRSPVTVRLRKAHGKHLKNLRRSLREQNAHISRILI